MRLHEKRRVSPWDVIDGQKTRAPHSASPPDESRTGRLEHQSHVQGGLCRSSHHADQANVDGRLQVDLGAGGVRQRVRCRYLLNSNLYDSSIILWLKSFSCVAGGLSISGKFSRTGHVSASASAMVTLWPWRSSQIPWCKLSISIQQQGRNPSLNVTFGLGQMSQRLIVFVMVLSSNTMNCYFNFVYWIFSHFFLLDEVSNVLLGCH